MKKIFLAAGLIMGFAAAAQLPKTNTNNTTQKKTSTYKKPATANSPAITLTQKSSYAAKGTAPSITIADPAIRAFNYNSYWQNNGGRLPGVPRGTYGFGNGQFYLRSTDATTSGGITGSGSVGTGGLVPGVNGKSPYAGPSMWGSARNLGLPDSVLRKP